MSDEKFLLQKLLTGKAKSETSEITWIDFITETARKKASGKIYSLNNDEVSSIEVDEKDNFISEFSAKIVLDALKKYRFDLVLFFLKHIAEAGKTVYPSLMPVLLEYCSENQRLNLHLAKVLGKSGLKLASLHPFWKYWYGEKEEDYFEMNKAQKLLWLRKMREKDTREFARFVKTFLPLEPPAFKVDFLKITAENPSRSDLFFLTDFSEDKSIQVRASAQPLMCALGDTEFSERAEKYFAEVTEWHRGKIFFRIPAQCTPEMKQDGFSDKLSPQEWAFRIFSGVSPAFVEKFFQSDIADLLALLIEAQYSDSVLSGFMQSVRLRGDGVRGGQLLAALYAQKNKTLFVKDLDLINLLEIKEAESIAEYFLKKLPVEEHYQYHPLSRLITHFDKEWSEKLTQTFVKALQTIFLSDRSPRYGLYWEDEIAMFALKSPVCLLEKLQSFYSNEARHKPFWQKNVQNMLQIWAYKMKFVEGLKTM